MNPIEAYDSVCTSTMVPRNNGAFISRYSPKDLVLAILERVTEQEREIEDLEAAARCTGLTDMGFILDAATKGELAAYEYAVQNMCVAVRKILNGKDTGHGICNEPWQSLRVQLLELVKAAQQQAAHPPSTSEAKT